MVSPVPLLEGAGLPVLWLAQVPELPFSCGSSSLACPFCAPLSGEASDQLFSSPVLPCSILSSVAVSSSGSPGDDCRLSVGEGFPLGLFLPPPLPHSLGPSFGFIVNTDVQDSSMALKQVLSLRGPWLPRHTNTIAAPARQNRGQSVGQFYFQVSSALFVCFSCFLEMYPYSLISHEVSGFLRVIIYKRPSRTALGETTKWCSYRYLIYLSFSLSLFSLSLSLSSLQLRKLHST